MASPDDSTTAESLRTRASLRFSSEISTRSTTTPFFAVRLRWGRMRSR
jgi:hypothetical protein